jgi:hypothetical protein
MPISQVRTLIKALIWSFGWPRGRVSGPVVADLGPWRPARPAGTGRQPGADVVGQGSITVYGYARTAGLTVYGYLGTVARPNQDRAALTVWVKRSSLAWLTETATAAGVPRSSLVRDLLTEAIAARQGRTAAAAMPPPAPRVEAAPAVAVARRVEAPARAASPGCRRCGCTVTRDAIRWGTCEGCSHPRLDHR